MAQKQLGILLLQNGVVPPRCELPVPAPPAPPTLPDPAAYAHLLPGVPPSKLRVYVVPASTKLGPACGTLLVIGERCAGSLGAEHNGQAQFLTASLQTGFGEQFRGAALALCAEPGRDLTMALYNAVDDIIRTPMMDTFGDGQAPTERDWAGWAQVLQLQLGGGGDGFDDEEEEEEEEDSSNLGEDISAGRRCAQCHAPDPPVQCGRCNSRAYCGLACQKQDWKHHQHACPSLAAALAHA